MESLESDRSASASPHIAAATSSQLQLQQRPPASAAINSLRKRSVSMNSNSSLTAAHRMSIISLGSPRNSIVSVDDFLRTTTRNNSCTSLNSISSPGPNTVTITSAPSSATTPSGSISHQLPPPLQPVNGPMASPTSLSASGMAAMMAANLTKRASNTHLPSSSSSSAPHHPPPPPHSYAHSHPHSQSHSHPTFSVPTSPSTPATLPSVGPTSTPAGSTSGMTPSGATKYPTSPSVLLASAITSSTLLSDDEDSDHPYHHHNPLLSTRRFKLKDDFQFKYDEPASPFKSSSPLTESPLDAVLPAQSLHSSSSSGSGPSSSTSSAASAATNTTRTASHHPYAIPHGHQHAHGHSTSRPFDSSSTVPSHQNSGQTHPSHLPIGVPQRSPRGSTSDTQHTQASLNKKSKSSMLNSPKSPAILLKKKNLFSKDLQLELTNRNKSEAVFMRNTGPNIDRNANYTAAAHEYPTVLLASPSSSSSTTSSASPNNPNPALATIYNLKSTLSSLASPKSQIEKVMPSKSPTTTQEQNSLITKLNRKWNKSSALLEKLPGSKKAVDSNRQRKRSRAVLDESDDDAQNDDDDDDEIYEHND